MKKIWQMSTFRLLFLVVVVVIPLNILTLVLSDTAVNDVEKQISAEIQNALDLYLNQVDGAMERIVLKLHYMARNDTDFIRINVKEIGDQSEYYRQTQMGVNLSKRFADVLNDNSWITGIYAIYTEKDFNIARSVNDYSNYKSALREYINEWDRQEEQTGLGKWTVAELDGIPVLIYTAKYRNAYYGAWIDINRLADTLGVSQRGWELATLFTDGTGKVYYANAGELGHIALDEPVLKYEGTNCVLIKAESGCLDFFLVQILSKSEITNSLPVIIRFLQIASFAALLILPIIVFYMQKWVIAPVSKLAHAMGSIEAGDMDFRIEEKKTGSEFEQINHSFNRMMDEVSELKINVYEEKLEKQQIKMRFLSQQIQPHFILNAMNILYSYEQEEYPLIQKMIMCLAKYFRHIVNVNSEFVRLQKEMDHIRNYFEIQQMRYPETFFAMVEYDAEIADCLVPPLIIQSFAENAIKHSLKIGNRIDIFVIAQKLGEDTVRIRILDTGEGIDEEVLEKIRRFRETGEYQEGLGVGIQNAVERLHVLYGVETRFEIVRDEPHGTRIEIVLPLYHAEQEED